MRRGACAASVVRSSIQPAAHGSPECIVGSQENGIWGKLPYAARVTTVALPEQFWTVKEQPCDARNHL